MLVYLAAPIDFVTGTLNAPRSQAKAALERAGMGWFDPSLPYGKPRVAPGAVYAINEAALAQADAVLALLPPGVQSVGVPMEIRRAHDLGKPVAVCGAGTSMQLMGMGGIGRFGMDQIATAVDWLRLDVDDQEARETLVEEAIHYQDPDFAQAEEPIEIIDRGERKLLVNWTGHPSHEPQRTYEGDAGWDLVCSEARTIRPGGFQDVPCGIRVELPGGTWAMITGRSSTLRRRGLLVSQGIIDNGYRGPLFAGVWNLGDEKQTVEVGERIAQLIPFPLLPPHMDLLRAQDLRDSDRGEQGFGSTGT